MKMTEENSDNKKEDQNKQKETPVWEWIIAAAGLILVVGAVGLTFYRATTEDKTPPQLTIEVDSIEPNGSGYLVKFAVKNTGNQTAAAVAVEGELKSETETVETSGATLTYSPANSKRRGGLFFTRDPQQFQLQIRVTGYEEP